MKRKSLIVILCSILIISVVGVGCSKKVINDRLSNSNKLEQRQTEIMTKFDELLKDNPSEIDIIKFVNDNIKYVSKQNASKLVLDIEKVQNKKLKDIQGIFLNGEKAPKNSFLNETIQAKMREEFMYGDVLNDLDNIDNVKDMQLKEFLIMIKDSGYKVICPEGHYERIINYEFYKQYSEYVTDDIKEYINIMADESNNVTTMDAGITISWEDLLKRALNTEEFLYAYPNSIKLEEIRELYLMYTFYYLYGANNTPVFEYQSNYMNDKAKKSYLSVELKENTRFEKLIKDYLPILKKNNYKLTDEVVEYRDEVYKNLKNDIGKYVRYENFDVERIQVITDNMEVYYPQIRNMVGQLKMDYINQDLENVVKTYINSDGKNGMGLKLDYEVTYVGDDFISIKFEGRQKHEGGHYKILKPLNYDVKTGYIVKSKNLIKHDKQSLNAVSNLLSKYAKSQGIKSPNSFGDWMGIYITKSDVVFYYLENDFTIEYTKIFVPKDEINPYLNDEIKPLDKNEMAS